MEVKEPAPPAEWVPVDDVAPTPPEGEDAQLDAAMDFCRDQKDDSTLSNIYEQLACMHGIAVNPWRDTQWS